MNSSTVSATRLYLFAYLDIKTTKATVLKVESFFKIPEHSKGFNLSSLCHFTNITVKPNIVSIIQKTVQHNNVIPWNPAQNKLTDSRSSSCLKAQVKTGETTMKKKIHAASSNSSTFNPGSSVHRCYLEDFITLLPVDTPITILLPLKECNNAKKSLQPLI